MREDKIVSAFEALVEEETRSLKASVANGNKLIDGLNKEITELKAKITHMEAEAAHLRCEKAELNKRLDSALECTEVHLKTIEERDARIAILESDMEELKKRGCAKRDRIIELNGIIDKRNEDIERLSAECADRANRQGQLQAELDKAHSSHVNELGEANSKIAALNAKLSAYGKRIDEQNVELTSLRQAVQERDPIDRRISRLTETVVMLAEMLKDCMLNIDGGWPNSKEAHLKNILEHARVPLLVPNLGQRKKLF